jgi:hypothetical protein
MASKFLKFAMICAVLLACITNVPADVPTTDPAADLRARYVALAHELATSPIQEGLHVESVDSSRALRGDAFAVLHHPFATVASALITPSVLCESLLLHLNVQYCGGDGPATLILALGRKIHQPLEDTYRIRLDFSAERSGDDFMRVELTAKHGPLGTSDYLIAVELVALDAHRSFMHIRYAYTQGVLARMATGAYFATNGREKVGFTRVRSPEDGSPQLVRGIRGVLERNTMRYFLAFNAWLDARESPPAQRFEASLERWFADTERYSRQLREVTREEYIVMKRNQYLRQQGGRLSTAAAAKRSN